MILKSKRASFEKFFFAATAPEALAFLRISLGIMLLIEWAQIQPSLGELFGPAGFLQSRVMDHVSGNTTASYAHWIERTGLPFSTALQIFSLVRWEAMIGFTLGIATRPHTVLLWFTQMVIMRSGDFSVYGIDRYFHLFLFLLIWIRADEIWSIPWWRSGRVPPTAREEPALGLRVLQLAVLITYVDAGFSKSRGLDWWNGNALWRAVQLPEFHHFDFYWLAGVPWLPKLLGQATMFVEIAYIVAVWIPWIGVIWTMLVIGMHLGIAVFMGLVDFGLMMALVNVALFLVPKWRGRVRDVPK